MASIDARLRKALTGISGILVTPFDEQDRVAPARLKPIVDRAVNAGVHILVANGNTGEFYGLTTAGVKWACPTPLRLAEAIRRSDPQIVWVGGLAETWAPPL